MSSDEKRITPDELKAMTEVRQVASLSMWVEDPYGAGDIGAETVASGRFGNTEAILVHGDLVLWGGVIVEAERIRPYNNGTVTVVDVAQKGWTLQEAKAEVLRRHRRGENTQPDRSLLAEMITELWEVDQGLVEATGWDGDDLDALIQSIEEQPDSDDETAPGGPREVECPNCRSVFTPASKSA